MGARLSRVRLAPLLAVVYIQMYMTGIRQVSVADLRQNLTAHLRHVGKGAELEVTSRGRVVARLVPAPQPKEAAIRLLERLRRVARVGDVRSALEEPWSVDR